MLGGIHTDLLVTVTLLFLTQTGTQCRAENDFSSVVLPDWRTNSEYVTQCFYDRHNNQICDWTSNQLRTEEVTVNILESGPLGLEGKACLEFWYLAPVAAKGSELRILLKSSVGLVEIWTSPALPRDSWKQVYIPLDVNEPGTQVVFKATQAVSVEGQVTFNRIGVRRGLCGHQCDSNTEFWTDESTHCFCSVSQLSCSVSQCPKGQICGPQRGSSSGISASGTCTIHSHTDCSTFDGVLFRFMAPCTYTLAKTCSSTKALPMFSVEVVNEQNRNTSLPTIQQVIVEIGAFRVSLLERQTHRVVVNGVWKKLPLTLSSGSITIKSNPAAVILGTNFGLSISYDNAGALNVNLPPSYADHVCGLCGNFNHLKEDDFRMPDGTNAPNATVLAQSWQAGKSNSFCETILVPHQCDPLEEAEYANEMYCGGLLSSTGPFADCLSVLGAESYFRGCVSGMCSTHGDPVVLCETLKVYADICQEAGVVIPIWRNSTFCALQCGENSHYSSCADGCPEVCSSLDIVGTCESCEERCECDSGFKLSGGKCVPAEDCGCWYNGKHYENSTRSKLEAVTLHIDNLDITLNQTGWVDVNNVRVQLPYFTNGTYGSIWLYMKSNYIILESTFGLRIMIDGQYRLFLKVDEHYKYELCGLCGTYSGQQDDDFVTPGGQNATGPFEFGDSWMVPGNDECTSHPNDVRLCDSDEENEAYYTCDTLLSDAFSPCHEHIHPSIYLNSCVYDYCATSGDQHTLCESLESYAAACQVAGVELNHWQTDTPCAEPPTTATPTTTPTSPTPDQTYGFYMYIEGNSVTHGDSARLMSSACHYDGPLCLHLWYHMYGSASAMALNIYLLKDNKSTKLSSVMNNYGPEWHPLAVDITVSGPFQIIVEGIRGSNAQSDVAIDDISIHFGSCSVCNFDCSYDSGLCSWNQMVTDAFDWTWQSGSTPTLMTGPSADHTGDGHYLYIEASSVAHGDTARLISSECLDYGSQCLQFWYHMYGSADTMGINVYLLQNKLANDVWSKRNDQGNIWQLAQVDFTTTGAFQIIIEGRRGSNEESDVAIDDVKLYRGRCSVCNIDCNFDSSLCNWNQMVTDAFDWTWQSGSTPTMMTGPSSDHTTGVGHYLYIEASSVTHGDTARLISLDCLHTGPQCLQFWYHMYGSADTMGINVYLYQDRKALAVWQKRNDQGNKWHLAQVDLTTTGVFQIIFEGRRGSNDQSDVAIDDVLLHHGHCTDHNPQLQLDHNPQLQLDHNPQLQLDHNPQLQLDHNPQLQLDHNPQLQLDHNPQLQLDHNPQLQLDHNHQQQLDHNPQQQLDHNLLQALNHIQQQVRLSLQLLQHHNQQQLDPNHQLHLKQFNEVWYTNHCQQKCECEKYQGMGRIDCDSKDECDGNAVCLQNEEGNYYCQSTGFNECTIKKEYKTFDKMDYDFKGEHSYVLVQTKNLPSNLQDVYIEAINKEDEDSHHNSDSSSEENHSRRVKDEDEDEDEDNDSDDSDEDDDDSEEEDHRLQALKIRVYNHTVEFRERRKLVVDGRRARSPVSPTAGLNIYEHFSRIYLKTDFGLSVEFDGHSKAEIILPRIYRRKIGGLCGNFDGQKQNDWVKPDGTRARSAKEFGESWRV
ncbi:LDL-receptor class A domain-containing protein 2 Skeletal organic matrix MAM and [Collichthys lucidus]|uniref:LDL-receptor class A domain-containing protein 2 Skeletal organic matrix MAM and n=1 Tax=Collichthys lucidus TaxID=240159 RepID=A0A4U5UX36_COLLU|nr:LDL-receptor class A domain-containing protein 2 Skeletal organic matrix MAM and [Collichthys lucidus]